MARRLKLLTGLSTLALTSVIAFSAVGAGGEGGEGETEGEGGKGGIFHWFGGGEGGESESESAESGEGRITAASSEGEGDSEGESASIALTDDNVSYLAALMMMRGHLTSGDALYAKGDRLIGAGHMRHPQAEMMTKLEPAFRAHGVKEVNEKLEEVASAAENGENADIVHERYVAASAKLQSAAAAVHPSVRETLLAAAKTLSTAGEEYDKGFKDGELVNPQEYQDAHGFMKVVVDVLMKTSGENDAEQQAIELARRQAELALTVAPSAIPPERMEKKSSLIYGAAARIEIAARGL